MKKQPTRDQQVPHAITYTVSGSGTFPIDALRRDCAYPATVGDSMVLPLESPRQITLKLDPVNGRISFPWTMRGWRVIAIVVDGHEMSVTRPGPDGVPAVLGDGIPRKLVLAAVAALRGR